MDVRSNYTGVSGGAVAYCLVIRTARAGTSNMTANQLTAAVIQNLQSGDANMKRVGQIQRIAVGGTSAGSVELETISPMAGADGKSQRERDWLVVVPRSATDAIFFVFVSPLAHYDLLRPTFEKMLRSAQFR